MSEILSRVKFFKPFLEPGLEDAFFGALACKEFPTNTSLFKYGEKSNFIYAIMKGRVEVLVPPKRETTEDKMKSVGFHLVGDVVGEFGVMNQRPRAATVIAREDLFVISLDRRSAIELSSNKMNDIMGKKANFLQTQIFSKESKSKNQKISLSFKERHFKKNQALCHLGQNLKTIDVLAEGSISLVGAFELPLSQPVAPFAKPATMTLKHEILQLGPGFMVGFLEMLNKSEVASYSAVVCSPTALVYSVPRQVC